MSENPENQLIPIKKMAELTEVAHPTLREWCNEGFVDAVRGARNARLIPESEKETILKVKEVMDRTPKPTYEEARELLEKDHLYVQKKKEDESIDMEQILVSAMDKQGFTQTFELVANEMKRLREDNAVLHEKMLHVTSLLEKQQTALPQYSEKLDELERQLEVEKKEKEEANKQVDREREEKEELLEEIEIMKSRSETHKSNSKSWIHKILGLN